MNFSSSLAVKAIVKRGAALASLDPACAPKKAVQTRPWRLRQVWIAEALQPHARKLRKHIPDDPTKKRVMVVLVRNRWYGGGAKQGPPREGEIEEAVAALRGFVGWRERQARAGRRVVEGGSDGKLG